MEANVAIKTNAVPTSFTKGQGQRPPSAGQIPAPNANPAVESSSPATPITTPQDSSQRLNVVSSPYVDVAKEKEVEDAGVISLPLASEINDEIKDATVSRVIDEANQALEASNFRLNYRVHDATNMVMVKVIDTQTDEVLREIPPESKLDIVAKIMESAGLLFDETS